MMLTELTSRVGRLAESARRRWNEFHVELRGMESPQPGDLVKLDRKGWQFARVSTVISCETPGKRFEIIGDDGRQYTIRPADRSSARWQLIRLM